MNKNLPFEDDNLIITDTKGNPATTSLKVAAKFEKEHKNVARAIECLDCSDEFRRLNFERVEIIEKNAIGGSVNKSYYLLSKDGFTFLAMGFTGKKAAKFKEDYIAAFNAMEKELRGSAPALPDFTDPGEAARAWAEQWEARKLAEAEKAKAITYAGELEGWKTKAEPKVSYYDKVANAPDTMSISAGAKLMGLPGIGRNKLYDKLRQWGIIIPGTREPYQKYTDQGWFKMQDVKKETFKDTRFYPTPRLTRKGLQKVYGKFMEEKQQGLFEREGQNHLIKGATHEVRTPDSR